MATQTSQPRSLDQAFALEWIDDFVARLAAQVTVLSDLDRQAGDGDFGANLTSALGKAQGFITSIDPQTFASVFTAVSKGFLNTGGTSGPLFGIWFHEIAKATAAEPVDVTALAAGVATGLATIRRLAGAKVGDNTMVDAIAPASEALTAAAARGADASQALGAAAEAARAGAESTRDLIASRGRASYVGEVARGVLDPGAVAVALFFASAVVTSGGPEPSVDWLTG